MTQFRLKEAFEAYATKPEKYWYIEERTWYGGWSTIVNHKGPFSVLVFKKFIEDANSIKRLLACSFSHRV
jgi:hypothetical protein